MKARVVFIAGSHDSPTEVVSWLLHLGVELHDMHVYQGVDGRWRGSGEVSDGDSNDQADR